MKKIAKALLGLLIITTTLVGAQTECIKRINRYTEAPSVVTIYPCNSILVDSDRVAILVDSIYSTEKIYRLYCEFNKPVEAPLFEVELTSGHTMIIFPGYTPQEGTYTEAALNEDQLLFFKQNRVRSVSVWHKGLIERPPKVLCKDYFSIFLSQY